MAHHDDARLDDLFAQLGDGETKDLFRLLLGRGLQPLIAAELSAKVGAELHERRDPGPVDRVEARPPLGRPGLARRDQVTSK